MADPLRNDFDNPKLPVQEPALDERSIDQLLAGFVPERTLPAAQNPRWNRTAETIGRSLGGTVGRVRSNLSVVRDRERQIAREITDTLSEQAQSISAAAIEKAERLGDVVEERTSQILDTAQQQWDTLSEQARTRVVELRKQAATLRDEHPLELVLCFAGFAFALGAGLKIWRSYND